MVLDSGWETTESSIILDGQATGLRTILNPKADVEMAMTIKNMYHNNVDFHRPVICTCFLAVENEIEVCGGGCALVCWVIKRRDALSSLNPFRVRSCSLALSPIHRAFLSLHSAKNLSAT